MGIVYLWPEVFITYSDYKADVDASSITWTNSPRKLGINRTVTRMSLNFATVLWPKVTVSTLKLLQDVFNPNLYFKKGWKKIRVDISVDWKGDYKRSSA